jgi:hypothetical protein
MKMAGWLLFVAVAAAIGFALWRWRRREEERNRAAEQRMAAFIAQAVPATQATPAAQAATPTAQPRPAAQALPKAQATPRVDADSLRPQKLLLEAAAKAGEAGEAALSIQLCARLLSRYPNSPLAPLARTAVEEQKKKLAKPQSSG